MRTLILLPVVLAAGGPAPGAAAPPVRVAAFFWHDSPADEAALLGFREGLRAARLPWAVEVSRAGGDPVVAAERLAAIRAAAPDLVLALGTRAALLAREAIPDRPICFTAVTNPVASGVASGWEGSGGRLAGNSNWLPARELLRTFRAAVPRMARLGVLCDPENPVSRAEVTEVADAIVRHHPDLALVRVDLGRDEAVGAAASRLCDAGVDAVWIPIDLRVYQAAAVVAATCAAARRPLLTSAAGPAAEAAAVGIVPDYGTLGRQAAEIARRILVEGADPGRLPVGRLQTFRVVVSLPAAERMGYEVPLPLLAIADEVRR